MHIFLILSLAIAIIAVVFAMQNLATVTVSFLFWSVDSSLALVLLITLAAGVLISLMASLPGLVRGKWAESGNKKRLSVLEAERSAYQQKAAESDKMIQVLEEQLASLSAELEKYLPENPLQKE